MKKFKAARAIGDLLHNQQFAHLEHKITELSAINQCLQGILPPEFRPLCQVANVREGQLAIATSQQAAATRLNFLLPTIIKAIQAQGYSRITRAKIIIMPSKSVAKPYWPATTPNEKTLKDLKAMCRDDTPDIN